MQRENGVGREEESLAALRAGARQLDTQAALLAAHRGDAAELSRLLRFLLASELLSPQERTAAVLAQAELAESHALGGSLRALWEAERQRGESLPLLCEALASRNGAKVH